MKRKLTKEELKQLLLHGGDEEIQTVISDIHPVMILDLLHEDIETAPAYLSHLSDEVIADIVEEEDDEHKYELLKLFPMPNKHTSWKKCPRMRLPICWENWKMNNRKNCWRN